MMRSFRRPRLTASPRSFAPRVEAFLRPRKIWSFCAGDEPSLSELMSDPIFGHLLTSDGLEQEHVETLITEMRYKLGYA